MWRGLSETCRRKNGIILGVAMAKKGKEIRNGEVRYSAAYPTGTERGAKRMSGNASDISDGGHQYIHCITMS